MQSLTETIHQLDRKVKVILRAVDEEALTRREKQDMSQLKLALKEVRLDIRDYEYAQTRAEQEKWSKIARHNLTALERCLLALGGVFGPVDIAEFGATIDTLKKEMT